MQLSEISHPSFKTHEDNKEEIQEVTAHLTLIDFECTLPADLIKRLKLSLYVCVFCCKLVLCVYVSEHVFAQ